MVVGEFTQETNLLVLGGGPGGYTAAFRAAELGLQTTIVNPGEALGGVCLHTGCVPSKTLLSIADAIHSARDAKAFGVDYDPPRIDITKVGAWVTQTVDRLAAGLASLCKKHNIEHIRGRATFENNKHVAVPGGAVPRIKFRRAIIATGSRPRPHPAAPFDGQRILEPGAALRFDSIPKSILIIGSGYQAVEIAGIYSALGSRVTLVDEGEQILPQADADLVRPLAKRLVQSSIDLRLQTKVAAIDADDAGVAVACESKDVSEQLRVDRVIVAIGQQPNSDALGLEHTGVKCDEAGFIRVSEQMMTDDPRILAVGDVTGGPLLADKAMHQGRVAAEAAAGWGNAFDARAMPVVVFTDPNLAWCGLTEREAKARDVPHEVVKIPWGASGRAVGMGRTEGMTKLIVEPDTKLVLGVGIVGPQAAEMIAEGALAIEMGAVVEDLARTVHPHPTMSELLSDAAARLDGATPD